MGSGRDVARLVMDGGGGGSVIDDLPELSSLGSAGGLDVAEAELGIGGGLRRWQHRRRCRGRRFRISEVSRGLYRIVMVRPVKGARVGVR